MKILIVDDKASIRSAMKKILAGLGFMDITEAVDGEDAWYKINEEFRSTRTRSFELIISDMEMPRMSGLELLRAVRSSTVLKDTPFIMATTVTAKQIILETMRLGIQAYIIKPFDATMVELKLKQSGIL
ncbi:MAG: response regulator [Proteobacteria bacterium]|nr:response regulator [Pseudomonadota bacterium]MBU1581331.1 response regulator [Pseudomonadota bacterium]MBU2455812.1 response regulator [Pseudomonadota bacterium]MBU2631271.1 response regulator [Pseudomonadota bacterium]